MVVMAARLSKVGLNHQPNQQADGEKNRNNDWWRENITACFSRLFHKYLPFT